MIFKIKLNWDALGITASLVCAIHCAILPLFLASLPLLGVNIIENSGFEYGMIALAFVVGIYSLWHGYRRHHHKKLPLLLFTIGMLCLVLKQLIHEYHTIILIPAIVFIIAAHWLNYRSCKEHNHAHTDDCDHDHF
jgi:hypothetical protein